MSEEALHVVVAADRDYLYPARVTIESVWRSSGQDVKIWLITRSGDRARRIFSDRPEISIVNPTELDASSAPKPAHLTEAIYYRFSIAKLLPSSVIKVLYLDVDILVLSDIRELFHVDIKGHCVAAVKNGGCTWFKALGLATAEHYFNSGVLLLDLQAVRATHFLEAALHYANSAPVENLPFGDQDALNIAAGGKWFDLGSAWNVQSRDFDRARLSSGINLIHFTATPKPWDFFSRHPLTELYLNYARSAGMGAFIAKRSKGGRLVKKFATKVLGFFKNREK